MRKYIRGLLRAKAERESMNGSRYVKSEFDKIQRKKYGRIGRLINQAKGTHKRNTWKNRVNIAV